jgi:hypothetical protein
VLALLLLALVVVAMLPYAVALPVVRNQWLKWLSARTNLQISVNDLSLGWFSPVLAGDIQVQNDVAHQAVFKIQKVEGNTPLWRLLFSSNLGNFRIVEPALNLEFDQEGSNLGRLLGVLGHAALFSNRSAQWEIVDGRFSVRGPSSPRPWVIDKVSLNMTVTPASQNPQGVPLLHGGLARLLNEAELTPELCNDLLKFIAPVLSQSTRTSGRVSLELDEFSWPLGKPELANVKGRLTLHSVETGPGELVKLLAEVVELKSIPAALQIAKDDVVTFSMHDGRVYHENLAFSLAAIQDAPSIRSHGSVGLDETLDWFLEFSGLGNALPADSAVRSLLSQLNLHFVGTLSSPKLAAPSLKAIAERIQQRRSQRKSDPSQPAQ